MERFAVSDALYAHHGANVTEPSEYLFRTMTEDDLDAVMRVELSGHVYPWSAKIFMDCMRTGYRCEVVEWRAEIIAFSVIQLIVGEAHILNVCVHSDRRQQGLGSKILSKVLDIAEKGKIHSIFLEVRPSNRAALNLYEKFGFIEVGLRKQYYPTANGREDALILAKELYFGVA